MATIRRFPFLSHLRADPNQHILHYRGGQLVEAGIGLAYFFNPLAAAIAQIPAEDVAATFVLQERTADLQTVNIQITILYRCVDPKKLATRINFTVALTTGLWLEQPLERLTAFWKQKAQGPTRGYLIGAQLPEAITRGAIEIADKIAATFAQDAEIGAMGLACVNVQIDQVSPSAELEKALQTPTREAIQQKADEATFQRRALAVEKERAIKENELQTELELAKRQEGLISQQGANRLREVQSAADAEKLRVAKEAERLELIAAAEAERRLIAARSVATETREQAEAQAAAHQVMAAARAAEEQQHVAIWGAAAPHVHYGLALQEAARHLPRIDHLNITPDLVSEALQKLLRDLGSNGQAS